MVDANPVAAIGGKLVDTLLSSLVLIVLGIVIIGFIGGLTYYFFYYRRQFNIMVKIRSQRASDPKIIFDKGAILTDRKTKVKYFKLLNTKVELPAPPFMILENTNWGDYLEIWRKSEDDFAYLTKARIDNERMVHMDGKSYPVAGQVQRQIEQDYFWIVRRKEENKKLIDPDTFWSKLLAWTPQIVSGFLTLMIIYIVWDKLPGLLQQLTELAKSLNVREATLTPA
jgi:hypothetical protein